MDRCKLPVRSQAAVTKDKSNAAASTHLKRPGQQVLSTEPKNTLPSCDGAVGGLKAVSNRSRVETELKAKNRLLMAENVNLQNTIKTMEASQEQLKDEVRELKHRLQNRNPEPVSELATLVSQKNKQRDKAKVMGDLLIRELQHTNLTGADQIPFVQFLGVNLSEARQRMRQCVEGQEAFKQEIEQYRHALEEAHEWLATLPTQN
ncbi:uncharacterized protein LOC134582453 [Pelobates fuscus]|uniref:uncharacterized protein LOC134582453 n=1 Tax=Pelobates fuscus TaxID=191477 RepID=UPI002FE4EC8B